MAPPHRLAAVHRAARNQARSGRASTIGISSASGGTGNTLPSATATTKSQNGAVRVAASDRMRA